ncbi:hypothetical protein Tfer_0957 [Thermincola ferriacetica]|uniref:Uncharacterized protein n=1 Tax=Thermincola ferriacetica TaxID=281456 RepID=A0A0L6W4T8_9FIRM|nr:hypothetical protein [Thermincola ferriacetica]KNZ70393.1 hypothetical protein Tfer_0957 [Thermincola ferriacetica]
MLFVVRLWVLALLKKKVQNLVNREAESNASPLIVHLIKRLQAALMYMLMSKGGNGAGNNGGIVEA